MNSLNRPFIRLQISLWRACLFHTLLTSEVGLGKIALIGELLVPPLLGGFILFSFWRRLQNQTRITSFSMLSCSAIKVISSEVGFWFSMKLFSKATRMLVSMLVRFFLLRFKPSAPNPGEFRALGLDAVQSDERFSIRVKKIQGNTAELKDSHTEYIWTVKLTKYLRLDVSVTFVI